MSFNCFLMPVHALFRLHIRTNLMNLVYFHFRNVSAYVFEWNELAAVSRRVKSWHFVRRFDFYWLEPQVPDWKIYENIIFASTWFKLFIITNIKWQLSGITTGILFDTHYNFVRETSIGQWPLLSIHTNETDSSICVKVPVPRWLQSCLIREREKNWLGHTPALQKYCSMSKIGF